jgi:hypothetical protein
VTGGHPRNDEELAQSEVECREGKPPHVRVLFCPWNMRLHLAEQTCVRQRKPRLLGMATFDDVYRFQVRGTIEYAIGSLLDTTLGPSILYWAARPNPTGVYREIPPIICGR